jgi:hypothetical protein
MRRLCGPVLALFFALAGMIGGRADEVNYTGHYELADAKADYSFSLDITQTGPGFQLTFLAGMADGSGAAPDGGGQGQVDANGALKFTRAAGP